jgi:hypothetical protein
MGELGGRHVEVEPRQELAVGGRFKDDLQRLLRASRNGNAGEKADGHGRTAD